MKYILQLMLVILYTFSFNVHAQSLLDCDLPKDHAETKIRQVNGVADVSATLLEGGSDSFHTLHYAIYFENGEMLVIDHNICMLQVDLAYFINHNSNELKKVTYSRAATRLQDVLQYIHPWQSFTNKKVSLKEFIPNAISTSKVSGVQSVDASEDFYVSDARSFVAIGTMPMKVLHYNEVLTVSFGIGE